MYCHKCDSCQVAPVDFVGFSRKLHALGKEYTTERILLKPGYSALSVISEIVQINNEIKLYIP